MPVGNLQKRSVKVSKCLDNYLGSRDNLISAKSLLLIITLLTSALPRPAICLYLLFIFSTLKHILLHLHHFEARRTTHAICWRILGIV